MHPLLKFIRHKWRDDGQRWQPFVAIHYLTYTCDFRCPYCANGAGIPYHRLPSPAVDGETALQIIGRIRQHADHLVLTGGEPLSHPEAGRVLAGLGRFGFDSVTLTTNGEHLDEFLPEIATNITVLGISLDTLDARKADAWFGKGAGMLARILTNIERAAAYPGRKFEILISAVATPNNIEDLYAVYAYAQEHGFQFSATPELQGVAPPTRLRGSKAYRDFFAFLGHEKAKDGNIFGSRQYLEHLADFRPFTCRPLTTLVVDPRGEVFYPCLEKAATVGNILTADLDALRRKAESEMGLSTACDLSCHSACALGLSLLIERPAREVADFLRQAWRSTFRPGG
jgi:MoaA/NifB/PqqE/SkfB family radical SAM enzyme